MLHKYRTLLLFAGFLTGGCATYRAKPLAPAQTAAAFEARTLNDPALRRFIERNIHHPVSPWPPPSWNFELLSLAAFYYQPDLDVARAQWSVAKAAQVTAGERPNPTLTASPEYGVNEPPGSSPWVAGLSLDIPVETAGKRGYRRQQSKAQAEAGRAHLERVAWQVRSRVRAALVVFSSALRSAGILRDQQAALNENKELLEGRSREGLISPLALRQAEVLSGKNEVSLRDAEREIALSQVQLADAIGLPAQALETVHVSTAAFERAEFLDPATLQEARRKALQNRSDLLESLAAYAASQHALQLEIARQYPDLHLGPGYLFDQGISRWALALAGSLPVFNRNRGAIGEAAARREEAAARFLDLQDQIIGEIDRAIRDYQAAWRKLETAQRLLEAHLRQEHELRRLLRPGDVSRLTLFRSRLDIDSTRLIASDALHQFHQAAGALEDALERPLPGTGSRPAGAETPPREER